MIHIDGEVDDGQVEQMYQMVQQRLAEEKEERNAVVRMTIEKE